MSLFGSSSSSGVTASSVASAQIKNDIRSRISQEIAASNTAELISKLNENCFKMCIQNPSNSLSSSEEQCISNCTKKYLSAWNTVGNSYIQRVQKASANGEIPK